MNNDPLGYAQFPGGAANTDGVVVDYRSFGNIGTATVPFHLGRTATHEVGHWLNCFHIWGVPGCNDSDLVGDTPNQDDSNTGCPSFPKESCNNGPNGDLFMNFMDYPHDNCMIMFTKGQSSRMNATLAVGGPRNSITNSNRCFASICDEPPVKTKILINTVIDYNTEMYGDIEVYSGAELTIDAKIMMREGARIYVNRGARLIIKSNGILTRGAFGGQNWEGVYLFGNSTLEQPDAYAPLTNPNQAGIVIVDGGRIEWARIGINALAGWGSEDWGGLVVGKNAKFINNWKDVAFMKYDKPNKSNFTGCQFLDIDNAWPTGTHGVSIWDTDGIVFEKCYFSDKKRNGIRTFDAATTVVNGNQFFRNGAGVSATATYPMSLTSNELYIGAGHGTENYFNENTIGVYVNLQREVWDKPIILGQDYNPNGVVAARIENNNFSGDGGLFLSSAGILVDGPTTYSIAGNLFDRVPTGIWTLNSGFNSILQENTITCNRFSSGKVGIFAMGNNQYLKFMSNKFELEPSGADFWLTSTWGTPFINGQIAAEQQALNFSAGNCFTNPGVEQDILTTGTTVPFDYYYLPVAGCEEPMVAGNYSKLLADPEQEPVDCQIYGGLPIVNPNPPSGYEKLVSYYDTLGTKEGQWALFGLNMGKGYFDRATTILNSLPIENDIDQQFLDIQTINIKRLRHNGAFKLDAIDKEILMRVANSEPPIRGYARAILELLDEVYFELDVDLEAPKVARRSTKSEDLDLIQIFPVPADTKLRIQLNTHASTSDETIGIIVFNIYGKKIASLVAEVEENFLDTSMFTDGVYYIRASRAGVLVETKKFVVQH